MKHTPHQQELIDLTEALVKIPSITLTKNARGEFNENVLASFIKKYFEKLDIPADYIPMPDGRKCTYVLKKGSTKKTLVLLGHIDTVGVQDFEGIDPYETKGADPKYMYGRGAGDMKSGLAVGMDLLKRLWDRDLQTNVIFIAAPDEENASAGAIAAGKFLQELKREQGLEYIGLINLDGGLEDPERGTRTIVAGGTVGKLLPCFYSVGRSAHASEPFAGISSSSISAEILRLLDGNVAYSDKNTVTGELTPPPTCLKNIDLKEHYDVQLPIRSLSYFNYLTYQENPKQVLEKMTAVARKALERALQDNKQKYSSYYRTQRRPSQDRVWDRAINVYSFAEVEKRARKKNPELSALIAATLANNKDRDDRERNAEAVAVVASAAQLTAPYVVCYFSPPYHPSSYAGNAPFIELVKQVVKEFGKNENIRFDIKDFCEGISDMTYMQIDRKMLSEAKMYTKNNPLDKVEMAVDLDVIADISMPITLVGPYVLHPHHRDEKVEIEYTFNALPTLLEKIIYEAQ